jgi:choice-of-anchor C domain-containing protein
MAMNSALVRAKPRSIGWPCALVAALLASPLPAAPQPRPENLIVNGSFESGAPIRSGGWLALQPGSAAIAGWQVVRGSVDYVNSYWQAADGRRSIDLDGSPGPGGVSQSFQTVPGRWYVVRFQIASNPEGPPRFKLMGVAVAGQVHRFSFDMSGHSVSAMGWVHKQFKFRAKGPLSTLEFYSLDAPGGWNGPTLDDVWVSPLAAQTQPTPAPAPPPSNSNLSGLWSGTYQGRPLRVRIRQNGAQVVATLVEGYGYVPEGNGAWSQLCLNRSNLKREPNTVRIRILNDDTIDLSVIGCVSAPLRLTRGG